MIDNHLRYIFLPNKIITLNVWGIVLDFLYLWINNNIPQLNNGFISNFSMNWGHDSPHNLSKIAIFRCSRRYWNCGPRWSKQFVLPNWSNAEDDTLHIDSLCHLWKPHFKASFSVHKLIPKNTQMTTLYTNLSLYITFTMIYYIRQEQFCKRFWLLSFIRRISGLFIANAMWTRWHVLSKM